MRIVKSLQYSLRFYPFTYKNFFEGRASFSKKRDVSQCAGLQMSSIWEVNTVECILIIIQRRLNWPLKLFTMYSIFMTMKHDYRNNMNNMNNMNNTNNRNNMNNMNNMNAVVESFFGGLKSQWTKQAVYETREQAKVALNYYYYHHHHHLLYAGYLYIYS